MTNPVEITLLTQDDCAFCDIAKEVLRRLGDAYPLRVTEIDVASDLGQQLARKAAVHFAPGVLVDGAPFSRPAVRTQARPHARQAPAE